MKTIYSDRRLTMDRRTSELATEDRWPDYGDGSTQQNGSGDPQFPGKIDARPHALPEECVAEIGPFALGGASERGAPGIRRGQHDAVVVGERRHEYS